MSARLTWFSLDNSLNPFENHQQSSSMVIKNNQNSISLLGKYSSFPRQQESRSLFQIQAIFDNFINKNESFVSRQDKFTFSYMIGLNSQPNVEESSIQSIQECQDSSQDISSLEQRKGLKSLATLMIKILKKKKIDSSKDLTVEIEQILMKGKKLSKNEFARQSKNIRRRTYDALNVMIAANVLGHDLGFIKKINKSSFTKKCGSFIGEQKQFQNKISQLTQMIQNKKQLLKQLRSKKQAMKWWIETKKNQSLSFSQKKQQHEKKYKMFPENDLSRIENQRINFPVIFISDFDQEKLYLVKQNGDNLVIPNFNNSQIKLFSEIDAIQTLKSQQRTSQYFSFDHLSSGNEGLKVPSFSGKENNMQKEQIFQVIIKEQIE